MSEEYLSTREVAEIFDVSIETVRQWRDAEPLCPTSPLRLVGERHKQNAYRYTLDQLQDFALRNPKYMHHWLLYLEPETVVYLTPPVYVFPPLQGTPQ